MLRISLRQESDAVTVKLEGKLLAAWGDEVQAEFDRAVAQCRCAAVRMDLSDLTYVDDAGTRVLRTLLGRGVVLGACSNFVAELLQSERA